MRNVTKQRVDEFVARMALDSKVVTFVTTETIKELLLDEVIIQCKGKHPSFVYLKKDKQMVRADVDGEYKLLLRVLKNKGALDLC